MTAAEFQAMQGKKSAPTPRTGGHPTKDTYTPREGRTAQISAIIGQPGVQVWNGVDGQGSVLRFFDLGSEDKQALLALAAERGIHPVRR